MKHVIEMGFVNTKTRAAHHSFGKWRQMRGPGRWRPALHSPTIARWFDSPQLSDVMRFASAPLLLCAVGLVPGAMLVKHLQLDKTAQADIISALVGMPVMLVLAWNGAGVWALVFGGITQAVVRTVAVIIFHPWWPRFHFTWRRIPECCGIVCVASAPIWEGRSIPK